MSISADQWAKLPDLDWQFNCNKNSYSKCVDGSKLTFHQNAQTQRQGRLFQLLQKPISTLIRPFFRQTSQRTLTQSSRVKNSELFANQDSAFTLELRANGPIVYQRFIKVERGNSLLIIRTPKP